MTTKYHINPTNGEVGPCKAVKQCRFGAVAHYESPQEAREAYEKEQKEKTLVSHEKPFAHLSFNEIQELETARFEEKLAANEPYENGEEYERRREYIRRMIKNYPSSQVLNTLKIKGKTFYTAERLQQHAEIIASFEEKYKNVPKEGKIILTGGVPGSGKTTVLKKYLPVDYKQYAIVNPDDVKEEMLKKNMGTEVPGLTPLETSDIIQYESIVLAEKVLDKLAETKTNLVIDKTMNHANPIVKNLEKLKGLGYSEIVTVFADVDPDLAYQRIRSRHLEDLNKYVVEKQGLGGRYVPGSSITATRTDDPNYKSKNAKTLVELFKKGALGKEPLIFDTNNLKPIEIPFKDFARE